MKTIVHVVGARPNYMKIAPLMDALRDAPGIRQLLVNTGQHYDEVMSTGFLKELGLPAPDRNLNVGSASHAVQTAKVMLGFETREAARRFPPLPLEFATELRENLAPGALASDAGPDG